MSEDYFKDCPYDKIDVYRVLEIFGVTCPVAQHVLKKALCAGQRGHKDLVTDWANIRDSASRKLEMMAEDAKSGLESSEDDGWIEWKGGRCPVDEEAGVIVLFRNGDRTRVAEQAGGLFWGRTEESLDITAYKVVG